MSHLLRQGFVSRGVLDPQRGFLQRRFPLDRAKASLLTLREASVQALDESLSVVGRQRLSSAGFLRRMSQCVSHSVGRRDGRLVVEILREGIEERILSLGTMIRWFRMLQNRQSGVEGLYQLGVSRGWFARHGGRGTRYSRMSTASRSSRIFSRHSDGCVAVVEGGRRLTALFAGFSAGRSGPKGAFGRNSAGRPGRRFRRLSSEYHRLRLRRTGSGQRRRPPDGRRWLVASGAGQSPATRQTPCQ